MFPVALALHLEERLANGVATIAVIARDPASARVFDGGRCEVRFINLDTPPADASGDQRPYVRDVRRIPGRQRRARGLPARAGAAAIAESDATLICVPVPSTAQGWPDSSLIASASRLVAGHLRPGHLVVVATTAYPGMTSEVVRPILESTGLRVGEEIFLAFAHRRAVAPRGGARAEQLPVVVGGCDRISTRLGVRLMQQVSSKVMTASSPAAAEMARLLEHVFRSVNTALVNQLAQLCHRMGLDVWEVLEAADPGDRGATPARPAFISEDCTPSGAYHLAWKAGEHGLQMDFIDLAERVNRGMPGYLVDRLLDVLHSGATPEGSRRVLMLGVASVPEEEEQCHLPAVRIIELLRRRNVEVLYHDPHVPEIRLSEGTDILRSQPLTRDLVTGAACVLILTDDPRFDYEAVVQDAQLVFDTRNATRGVAGGREKVVRP